MKHHNLPALTKTTTLQVWKYEGDSRESSSVTESDGSSMITQIITKPESFQTEHDNEFSELQWPPQI